MVLLRSDFLHRRWVPCESHKNRAPFLKQLHAGSLSVNLHEFFGVSVRTLRRWKADGADLECAESLRQYVRNQLRPAESGERRVYSPTFKEDLERILHPDRQETDCNAFLKDLAGDPDFEPPFDIAKLPDGPCYEPSDFSARVLQELRTAFTGIGIMVRLLEGDTELEARYGDARTAFAGDGPPVDDRDLMTLLILVENLLSAQLHRVHGSCKNLLTLSDCQEGVQCPEGPKVGTK